MVTVLLHFRRKGELRLILDLWIIREIRVIRGLNLFSENSGKLKKVLTCFQRIR